MNKIKKLAFGVATSALIFGSLAGATLAEVERVAGDWELTAPNAIVFGCGGDYAHTLETVSNNDPTAGMFMGTGSYDANGAYTWDITGEVNGSDVSFALVYSGVGAGYTLNGEGTIAADGSIIGTTDGNCLTFDMPAGTAMRFEGNHGQYVRMSENKKEAAQSRPGMPVQSKGHTK